jgi:hypothetical protein
MHPKKVNDEEVRWSKLTCRWVQWQNIIKIVINFSLMFILCIIWRIRNNQQYAQIYISLFYILAATCFSSSLPSSGSIVDPSGLLEIQIKWMVYYMMCGYMTCVLDCHGSVCCVSQLSQLRDTTDRTRTIWHTGHITTHYMIYHPFNLNFK